MHSWNELPNLNHKQEGKKKRLKQKTENYDEERESQKKHKSSLVSNQDSNDSIGATTLSGDLKSGALFNDFDFASHQTSFESGHHMASTKVI